MIVSWVKNLTTRRAFALGATVVASLWLAAQAVSLVHPRSHAASASERDACRVGGAFTRRPDHASRDAIAEIAVVGAERRDEGPRLTARGDASESRPHDEPPLTPPGVVHVQVIDEVTGRAAERVALRLLHPERFVGEDDLPGAVTLSLTPGCWSGQIEVAQRELAEVPPFEVIAGDELVLPPIVVRRGSAAIEGRVIALHLDPAAPLVVQLQRSTGRHAGPPRSVAVGADRRFRFGELVAGYYRLSAGESGASLLDVECLELAAQQCAHVDLTVGAPASLALELRDPEGRLLRVLPSNWIWSEPGDELVFEIRSSRGVVRRCSCRLRRDSDIWNCFGDVSGRSSSTTSGTPTFMSRSVPGRFLYVSDTDDSVITMACCVDRARTPIDGLFPASTPPDPLGAALQLQVERLDQLRLQPLPPEIVTLVVRCGPLATEPMTIDLRFGAPALIEVHLKDSSSGECAASASGDR